MAYVSNTMRNMRRAYDDLGLWGITEEIRLLDLRYAPKPHISRLTTPVLMENGILLLAQVPELMLKSILDNTLVEKFKAQTIVMKDWNLIPRAVKEKKEPAIYLNYYTATDGSGLSIPEYEDYLQAMEDTISGNHAPVFGIDIVAEVNKYYRQRTGQKGAAFLTAKQAPLRENLPDLMTFQRRVIRAARARGCSEIRFPGEVGWAINTDTRVQTHHKLQGSADLFRLTMCVVSVLFPQRNFELNSFCLFRAMSWNHAEIVSSLFHMLNGLGLCTFSRTYADTSTRESQSDLTLQTATLAMAASTTQLLVSPSTRLSRVMPDFGCRFALNTTTSWTLPTQSFSPIAPSSRPRSRN